MARMFLKLLILEEARRIDDVNARRPRRSKRLRKFKTMSRGAEFINNYALSEDLINVLESDISIYIPSRIPSSGLTTTKLKILYALSFLANGSHQEFFAQNVDTYVSQACALRAIRQVVNALNRVNIVKKYIRFPQDQDEREVLKQRFYQKFKIPGVLGCIDSTLVSMIRPKQDEEKYYCGEGCYARNVHLINDADLNIINVDVAFGGTTHDNFEFLNTKIKEYLVNLNNNGETVHLLGGASDDQRTYLMTPFKNPVAGTPESHYNKLHTSALFTVQKTLGLLKGRFKCLLLNKVLHYDPIMVRKIVIACCVLHNMCNRAGLPYPKLNQSDIDEETRILSILMEEETQDDLERGWISRRNLVKQLWREQEQHNI